MNLAGEDVPALKPLTEAGSGKVYEKEKAFLAEIIEKANDQFTGELSETDKLVYINDVLKVKQMECETLQKQAANNSKEQFANSPDLRKELVNAIVGALNAHSSMSSQALNWEFVQVRLRTSCSVQLSCMRALENVHSRSEQRC